MNEPERLRLREGLGPGVRCTCGKTFYAWHNPTCVRHPLPADGSECVCCGAQSPPQSLPSPLGGGQG